MAERPITLTADVSEGWKYFFDFFRYRTKFMKEILTEQMKITQEDIFKTFEKNFVFRRGDRGLQGALKIIGPRVKNKNTVVGGIGDLRYKAFRKPHAYANILDVGKKRPKYRIPKVSTGKKIRIGINKESGVDYFNDKWSPIADNILHNWIHSRGPKQVAKRTMQYKTYKGIILDHIGGGRTSIRETKRFKGGHPLLRKRTPSLYLTRPFRRLKKRLPKAIVDFMNNKFREIAGRRAMTSYKLNTTGEAERMIKAIMPTE